MNTANPLARFKFIATVCLVAALSGCGEKNGAGEPGTDPADGIAGTRPVVSDGSGFEDDPGAYSIRYFGSTGEPSEDAPVLETEEPLVIVDHGPKEVLPPEMRYPSLYVAFSQPVVPLARLGEVSESSDVLSIDPPIRGSFRWYGTRLLGFEAAEEVLAQRVYTMTVSADVESLGGKPLRGDRIFRFETEPVSVLETFAGYPRTDPLDVPTELMRRVYVRFSYPVNPAVISRYVSVDYAGRRLQFEARRPSSVPETPGTDLSQWLEIGLSGPFEPGKQVTVTIKAGARSDEGFAGTRRDIDLPFETLKPFEFVEWDAYSWTFPRSESGDVNPVYLRFSHPVGPEGLPGLIRTVPDAGPGKIDVRGETVRIDGLDVESETELTFVLDGRIEDIYGRPLGKAVRVKVLIPPPERYAYFPETGTRMLEASFPPRIIWEMRNVFDGEWKAEAVEDPYLPFEPGELGPYDFSGIEKNERVFRVLDLGRWLNDAGRGFVGVSWNFRELENGVRSPWGQRDLMLQVTDLGLTVRYAYNRIVLLVTALSTGEPVENAEVDVMSGTAVMMSSATDEQGLAVFDLEGGEYARYFRDPENEWRDTIRFEVRKGLDKVQFEPNYSHDPWMFGLYAFTDPLSAAEPRMATFLFTDRGLYRPGETLSFRGIDQDLVLGEYVPYWGDYTLDIRDAGYDGTVHGSVAGETTESGTFYGSYRIPVSLDPGYYLLQYERGGKTWSEYFQVAEFRDADFEVSVGEHEGTAIAGDTITLPFDARYLSGGALSGVAYQGSWFREPSSFTPDGDWEGYRFGRGDSGYRESLDRFEGRLDADGSGSASQRTRTDTAPGVPYRYSMETRVADADGREIAARTGLVVHPASFYAGVRMIESGGAWSGFAGRGERVDFEFALADPLGRPYRGGVDGGTLTARLVRVDWKLAQQQGVAGRINTRYERVEETEDELSIRPDSDMAGEFSFTPARAGLYFVALSGLDGSARPTETRYEFYVTGADWIRWGGQASGQIVLEPDKAVYEPGETAKLLLRSPLPAGTYLITVEREGIFEERLLQLEGSAQVIGIPILERHIPVVYVSVASYSVRTGEPSHTYFEPDLDKPKGYYGVTAVAVDVSSRVLDVAVDTRQVSYRPGDTAEVEITVLSNGKPAENVELAFLAVDRGVLDLIDYHVPNPVEFFYDSRNFPLGVRGADSRSLLIDPVTYDVKELYGGDSGDGKGESIRTDFRPTAAFIPIVRTDRRGKAVVTFVLPDSLTTYRCSVVAARGNSFGFAEDELLVRNPINVDPFLPLGFRLRDTVYAGVRITNLLEEGRTVTVEAESELLTVEGSAARTVTVGPGETGRAVFRLAAPRAGAGELRFRVTSDVLDELIVETVTVSHAESEEAVTTAGRVPEGGRRQEGLVLPGDPGEGGGELTLTLSPSISGSLDSAIRYLRDYPFDNFEQRSGRLLPLLLFPDTFGRVDAEREIGGEIETWGRYQLADGGFPFWPNGSISSYYGTLRAAHALILARREGFRIPPAVDTPALIAYLAGPGEYVRRSPYLYPYGLYVRALFGERVDGEIERFLEKGDAAGISGYALAGLAFAASGNTARAAQMLRRVDGYVRPGTRTADIVETYESEGIYDRRSERLALAALLYRTVDPGGETGRKLAESLLQERRNGRWANTVDTAWALIALDAFGAADVNRGTGGTVTAGGAILAEKAFPPGTADPAVFRFGLGDEPLAALPRDTIVPVDIERTGEGELYYALTLRYSIPAETARPRDEGIGVYFAVEDLDGNPVGADALTAGTTYRGKVVVSSSRHRRYLAVRVPVPSGADILDTSLITTARYEEYAAEEGPRPARIMVRDREAVVFYDDFPAGRGEQIFLFRALFAGLYPTPPVTAECMYEPEVFGRTAGLLYTIRPAE